VAFNEASVGASCQGKKQEKGKLQEDRGGNRDRLILLIRGKGRFGPFAHQKKQNQKRKTNQKTKKKKRSFIKGKEVLG